MSLVQAFIGTTGSSRLDEKGEIQGSDIPRMRVPRPRTVAGLLVVVMKFL